MCSIWLFVFDMTNITWKMKINEKKNWTDTKTLNDALQQQQQQPHIIFLVKFFQFITMFFDFKLKTTIFYRHNNHLTSILFAIVGFYCLDHIAIAWGVYCIVFPLATTYFGWWFCWIHFGFRVFIVSLYLRFVSMNFLLVFCYIVLCAWMHTRFYFTVNTSSGSS